jgi:hypothetical protein
MSTGRGRHVEPASSRDRRGASLLSFEGPGRKLSASRASAMLENCTKAKRVICTARALWALAEHAPTAPSGALGAHRQDAKGTRWMPWHQEPKKDVDGCDKPR